MSLAEHRTHAAHLHHQPFEHFPSGSPRLRHELPGLLGQIDQNGARLHQTDALILIDDRRDLVVRTDFQEIRFELLLFPDVDPDGVVGQPEFLKHDGDLPSVRCRPRI